MLGFRENPLISACGHDQVNVTERAVGHIPSATCKEMVKNCSVNRRMKKRDAEIRNRERHNWFPVHLPILVAVT